MSTDTPLSIPLAHWPVDRDEALCLRRARRGDEAALAWIYQRHARALHSLAWRLVGSPQAAEDIVQDAFMRLLGGFTRIDPERPIGPWLRQVVANLAIDRLRRDWRMIEDEGSVLREAPAREPADHAEASGLLRHLTPQARALVWLNQVEGWSHQALGRRFGRSESWSKSIVSRALAQLRDIADHPGTPTHEH